MPTIADRPDRPTAIQTNLAAIFISLELSRSIWLITSLSPGSGEKMSKHSVPAGDIASLLARFSELQEKALARTGKSFPIVVIQEAGLDGFWLHRVLQSEGIESHVVDPASIATSRRRRPKTDRIDGEALVRALLAFKRGEPRVCAMVKSTDSRGRRSTSSLPRAQSADRRAGQACQSRQGTVVFPGRLWLRAAAPQSTPTAGRELTTGDGRTLPIHLKTQISREAPIGSNCCLVKSSRWRPNGTRYSHAQQATMPAPAAMLLDIKGVGPEFAAVLWSEGLFRHFDNRRQVAAYAGPSADTLAERIDRSRARRLQGRQSTIASHAHRTRLAMAAPSAAIGAGSLVQRTGHPQRRSHEKDADCRARAQASGGAMEVCHGRRRRRRGRDESRLTEDPQRLLKSPGPR